MSTETAVQVTTSSGEAAAANAARPTVLVVDDHAVNRDLLRTYLKADYRVIEADDGFTALEVLAREQVDLVLLDVMMPRLNGFATCARIKVTQRSVFLPVILVTALDDRDSRTRGLAAGADDFLSRPVDRNELLLRVRAFLKLREHEALIQDQVKQLKRLQSLKDDMATFIFSDLRNPLSSVEACLNLLKRELPSPVLAPFLEDVDRAVAATSRVQMILDDVLDVRLLEEGELAPKPEATRLRALVVAAAATLEGAVRAKRIEVQISASGEPSAMIDRTLVRRSVENLIANAVRHSAKGDAIAIEVRCEPAGVVIEVADRGAPIPDELKRRLFEKFGLLDGPHRGIGVGLHLVKLVADLHGGTASVRDREGGGSVFRLVVAQGGRDAL